LRTISVECTQYWERLPSHLRYELYDEDSAWHQLGASITVRLIASYLEYLLMHFQIQHLLQSQTQQALSALLDESLKLLSTALVFTKPLNAAYETRRHFATVIMFYCFPTAGVLALELRKSTIEGVPLPDTVFRADVIRSLSVLTFSLGWLILPGDGNHKLCTELNKMLALVLDEVLSYEPSPTGSNLGSDVGNLASGFFDIPMLDNMEPIPTQAEDFLTWLNGAAWNDTRDMF
jgi:hypothetical protein